jgi:hypothetical protein
MASLAKVYTMQRQSGVKFLQDKPSLVGKLTKLQLRPSAQQSFDVIHTMQGATLEDEPICSTFPPRSDLENLLG